MGFKRSKGLAELARRHAECRIIEGDFETYDFSNLQVDAIVLVGALVHVPYEKFKIVFKNITYGLSESGKVLITLKQGEGTFTDEHGRVFFLCKNKNCKTFLPGLVLKSLILHLRFPKFVQMTSG